MRPLIPLKQEVVIHMTAIEIRSPTGRVALERMAHVGRTPLLLPRLQKDTARKSTARNDLRFRMVKETSKFHGGRRISSAQTRCRGQHVRRPATPASPPARHEKAAGYLAVRDDR